MGGSTSPTGDEGSGGVSSRYAGHVDFNVTVRAEAAPEGIIPKLVDMPSTGAVGGHRFRFEPWRLADGQVYVIARGVDDAQSIAECENELAEWVRFRWGAGALILEDWGLDAPRYRQIAPNGERVEVDGAALEERGFVLTEEPPQSA